MMKTLTAALTALALSLTPATPALAQNYEPAFDHEDAATAIFALLAFGVLAKALSDRNDDDDHDEVDWQDRDWRDTGRRIGDGGLDRAHREPPVTRGVGNRYWTEPPVVTLRDRGGLRDDRDNYASVETRVLPSRCLRSVDTRYGDQLFFGRHCLANRYGGFHRLPARCEVRLYTGKATRHGYDPLCLRQEGYTTTRH